MGSKEWTADSDLIHRILHEAHRFSFFQVVQLLERSRSGVAKVGYGGPAAKEVLRFRPHLSLAFPKSDLESIELTKDGEGVERYLVETTFLGLYGTTSPLPTFYTESLFQDDDEVVRSFLDVFHHRFLSLFYRCWEKYRYYVQFLPGGKDKLSQKTLCFMGLGGASLPREWAISPVRLLRYVGLLNQKPRSATSLERTVSDYFSGVPAKVTHCVEQWVKIPAEYCNRVGIRKCRLGVDLHLGECIRDRSGKFRVTLGPLSLEAFLGFLPGGRGYRELVEIVRLFNSDQLRFEVELVLRREEIPEVHLSKDSMVVHLGQSSWLGTLAQDGHAIIQEFSETEH